MYFQTASLPGNLDRTLLTARKPTNFIPKKVARSVSACHFRSYRSLSTTHKTLATLYGLSPDLCSQSISILSRHHRCAFVLEFTIVKLCKQHMPSIPTALSWD
jgi:hypothetical protein